MRLFSTIVGVVATSSIAGIIVLSLPSNHAAAIQPATPSPPATPATTQPHTLTPRQAVADSFLRDLALTPKALCAAGATASEIGGVIANADAFLQSCQVPLAAAETAVREARQNLSAAQSRPASTAGASSASISTLRAQITAAEQQRDTLMATAFTTITSSLPEATRVALTNIRANRNINLPIHFLVTSRSSAQWAALRRELEHKSARAREGRAPDAAVSGAISAALAEAPVAAARQRIEQGLVNASTAYQLGLATVGD